LISVLIIYSIKKIQKKKKLPSKEEVENVPRVLDNEIEESFEWFIFEDTFSS
jgi:hypothetical protein